MRAARRGSRFGCFAQLARQMFACYTAWGNRVDSGGEAVNELIPVIYQYGVGGIVFVVGLALVTRSRALDLSTRRGKCWFATLIGGFVFYLCLHLFFQFVAPHI